MGGMGNIALNEWLLLEAPICNPSVRHWAKAECLEWEGKRTGGFRTIPAHIGPLASSFEASLLRRSQNIHSHRQCKASALPCQHGGSRSHARTGCNPLCLCYLAV